MDTCATWQLLGQALFSVFWIPCTYKLYLLPLQTGSAFSLPSFAYSLSDVTASTLHWSKRITKTKPTHGNFFPLCTQRFQKEHCFNLNWPQVPRCCWLVLTELLSHALEFLWLSRHFELSQASRWTMRNWQREQWYQNQRSRKYWCQAKFKWK